MLDRTELRRSIYYREDYSDDDLKGVVGEWIEADLKAIDSECKKGWFETIKFSVSSNPDHLIIPQGPVTTKYERWLLSWMRVSVFKPVVRLSAGAYRLVLERKDRY